MLKVIDMGVGEICCNILQGCYFFVDSEKVVSLSDFECFFGVGGMVDSYFKKNLESKVDIIIMFWCYKGSVSCDGLEFFEQVVVICNVLFNVSEGCKVVLDFLVFVCYLVFLIM